MGKIEMRCVRCEFKTDWYEAWWEEVMEKKIDRHNYVCSNCYNKIANFAYYKWLDDYKTKQKKGLKS